MVDELDPKAKPGPGEQDKCQNPLSSVEEQEKTQKQLTLEEKTNLFLKNNPGATSFHAGALEWDGNGSDDSWEMGLDENLKQLVQGKWDHRFHRCVAISREATS